MKDPFKKNIVWLTEFHQKSNILNEVCEKISYSNMQGMLWESNTDSEVSSKDFYSLRKFPSFLQIQLRKNTGYISRGYPSVKGFTIDMSLNKGVEDYMRSQFHKKVRAHQMRALRRFEHCFDLRQERYYGHIDEEKCMYLLEELRKMIAKRFKQRQQESDTLKVWDTIEKNTYNHVMEKKASIFVITHRQKPISISISYHYDKLFFYYITSYDTDYAKFSIGNIMIMKQLAWCYEQGFKYFDMGWGELDYKRRWCNLTYYYSHIFIFPRSSLPGRLWSFILGSKTTVMAYLLNRGYNKKYHRLKDKLRGNKQSGASFYKGKADPIRPVNSTNGEQGTKVDPAMYPGLSYHIYNFLYSTQEKFMDVKLYQLTTSKFKIRAVSHEQIIEL